MIAAIGHNSNEWFLLQFLEELADWFYCFSGIEDFPTSHLSVYLLSHDGPDFPEKAALALNVLILFVQGFKYFPCIFFNFSYVWMLWDIQKWNIILVLTFLIIR